MGIRAPHATDPVMRVAEAAAGLLARWHRARLDGAEHLRAGPALLVGNHGLYGLETPAFFWLLRQATCRYPIGLTDRRLFSGAPVRHLLSRVGGVVGTRANARALLADGHLVVCYPGGSREVFKGASQRYRLAWERARGFAALAYEAQVPIVPFAGIGVDCSYVHLGHLPRARALFGRYAVPVALGLGPLPLPVRFSFRLGAPLPPPAHASGIEPLRDAVRASVESLLGLPTDADPAPAAAVVR